MLPRKAILRTVTSSVALILFALTGRISDPELATLPASACPEEPGELRLLPNSKSCNVEVLVCEPLGLAYLHNYKSAGSSFIAQLSEFCRNATGESADRIAGWNRDAWQLYGNETGIGRLKGSPCDADLLCSSPGWTCYSSIRDPLPRFLSGYHEISKRRETPLFQAHMHPLPSNATDPEKLKQLSKLLTLLQRYPNLDAHVGLQSNFFPRRRKIPLFRVEDGPKPVQDFLCRSLDCANRKSITPDTAPCPRIPLSSHRSRKDPDYRIPQYDIQPELLSPELIQRITDLYREDYCAFGYAAWPGARLDCSK